MAQAEPKVSLLEEKIKFRGNINDLIIIAKAVCRPGQSVEDLLGVLNLSISNDLLLEMLMEKIELSQQVPSTNNPSQIRK